MGAESRKSIYVAVVCDIAIAASKFVAAAFTGSSAMIAEGTHSLVDSCQGALLIWGKRASEKAPDADHPFGYGKELYFWTLVVTVLMFAIGGGMSIYEGVSRALHQTELKNLGWNYSVLAFAGIFEAVTTVAAFRDFRKAEGPKAFWSAFRMTKDPAVVTVLLDNTAALIGLGVAFTGIYFGNLFQMPFLDGIASALIGVMLAGIALILAFEIKGLLIGEGMDKQTVQKIRKLAESEQAVIRAGTPLTMYFGPHSILLALDVEFDKHLSAADIVSAVDRLERSIRNEYPNIQRIFIEAESLGKAENRNIHTMSS